MNIRNNIETTRVVNSKINLSILNSQDAWTEEAWAKRGAKAYPGKIF